MVTFHAHTRWLELTDSSSPTDCTPSSLLQQTHFCFVTSTERTHTHAQTITVIVIIWWVITSPCVYKIAASLTNRLKTSHHNTKLPSFFGVRRRKTAPSARRRIILHSSHFSLCELLFVLIREKTAKVLNFVSEKRLQNHQHFIPFSTSFELPHRFLLQFILLLHSSKFLFLKLNLLHFCYLPLHHGCPLSLACLSFHRQLAPNSTVLRRTLNKSPDLADHHKSQLLQVCI